MTMSQIVSAHFPFRDPCTTSNTHLCATILTLLIVDARIFVLFAVHLIAGLPGNLPPFTLHTKRTSEDHVLLLGLTALDTAVLEASSNCIILLQLMLSPIATSL